MKNVPDKKGILSGMPEIERPRVLLADDDADMRDYVRHLLASRYTVAAVADGQAALEEARRNRPDLVLADVTMPRLDGFALLQALRADPRLSTVPVVLLSARTDEESRLEELEAEADDYLIKPFSDRELLARVTVHVELARLREEVERADERRKADSGFCRLMEANIIGIVFADTAGSVTEANDAFLQLVGYDREDLLSGRIRWKDITPPEYRAIDERAFEEMRNTGRCTPFEKECFRRDGSRVPILVGGALLEDAKEQMVAFVVDLTEHKQAEEALRFSEARYRTLHRDNPTMIFTLDPDGTILSVNPFGASVLGYTIDELEGQPVLKVVHEEDRPAVAEQLQLCLRNPSQAYRWQFRKVRKDGGLLWVEELAQAVYDLNGMPNALVVCQDVTERKRAEEALEKVHGELERRVAERTGELSEANLKLQEIDRLKSMFIASMSHELRTPLNSVIGFSSVLLNELAGPLNREQKENLEAILRSGKHLLALINDVIDVSRIEAGKIEPFIEEFDIHGLIEEAADLINKDARGKGLALKVEAIRLKMNTDRRRLLQCVINLLSNAVKFTEEGSVRVVVQKADEVVEIAIEDTGIGIRQEDMPKLFLPFVRLVTSDKAVIPGTGIGLYLTGRLVREVLMGEVMCESTYGRGTTFTLKIPERLS